MKFWIGFFTCLITLSLVWTQGITTQLGTPTPTSRWVFDAYQLKLQAAEQITVPKVLVVAGSNAMFGIDSKQLSEYWQRPTINMAVNAGLGLDYILAQAQKVARRGDILVLPLEYALYLDNGEANSQIIDYVIGRDSAYWNSLTYGQRTQYIVGMAPERWIQGLRKPADSPVTSGTYGAHHLNTVGDQTFSGREHQQEHDRAAIAVAASPKKAWTYGERALQEKGAWDKLRQFAEWSRENQICLIAVPTALLFQDSYRRSSVEQRFYESLPDRVRQLGISYVGQPYDFMYPADHFFDTDHHLQDWARTIHTRKLITLFKASPMCWSK
jgi:hypothetical protein